MERPLQNYIKLTLLSFRRTPDQGPGQAPESSVFRYFLHSGSVIPDLDQGPE
jgi:hypothetical protein